MTEPETRQPKTKLEFTDVIVFAGLLLLFVGAGFAISWPVACMITGGVLIGLGIWLLTPARPLKGQ